MLTIQSRSAHSLQRSRSFLALATIALVCLYSGIAQAQERRIAFVIGNSDYDEIRDLPNPVNDADAVAKKLKLLGFALHGNKVHHNMTRRQLQRQIKSFAQAADDSAIAFLYFAGHGMQFDGDPHLLPVDIPDDDDLDIVRDDAIGLNRLLTTLNGKAELTVAVFDACREIPNFQSQIQRSALGGSMEGWRGLSRIRVSVASTLIAYSGGAGQLVADGQGEHSPYTELLLSYLDKDTLQEERLDVPGLFAEVAYQFRVKHNGQLPELINQGVRPNRYYLTSLSQEKKSNVKPPPISNSNSNSKLKDELKTGSLTVRVNPSDARVKIMNIVPKYRDGIALELNKDYDILISHEGYESHRFLVRLLAENQTEDITLRKIKPIVTTEEEKSKRPLVEASINPDQEPRFGKIENERWILIQDPKNLTVQLATSRELGYIKEIAQSLSIDEPIAIYRFLTTKSPNPVFGLVAGLYNDRESAIRAVENYPKETKQFGAWIRPIGDLQADIKKATKGQ